MQKGDKMLKLGLTKHNSSLERKYRRALTRREGDFIYKSIYEVHRDHLEDRKQYIAIGGNHDGVIVTKYGEDLKDLNGNIVDIHCRTFTPIVLNDAFLKTVLEWNKGRVREGTVVRSMITGREGVVKEVLRESVVLTECGKFISLARSFVVGDIASLWAILAKKDSYTIHSRSVGTNRLELYHEDSSLYHTELLKEEDGWKFSVLTYLIGYWEKATPVVNKLVVLDAEKLLKELHKKFEESRIALQKVVTEEIQICRGIGHPSFLIKNRGELTSTNNPYSIEERVHRGGPCHAIITYMPATTSEVLRLVDHVPMGRVKKEQHGLVKDYLSYLYNDSFLSHVFLTKDIEEVMLKGQEINVEVNCTEVMMGCMLSRFVTEQAWYREALQYALENGASMQQAMVFANLVFTENLETDRPTIYIRNMDHQIFYSTYSAEFVNNLVTKKVEMPVALGKEKPYRTFRQYSISNNFGDKKGETFLDKGLSVLNREGRPFERTVYTKEDLFKALQAIMSCIDA